MAYCVAGNYTIQNCLGIGIDPASHALDIVGVGTTANTGGVIGVFRSIQNAARLYIVDEDGTGEKPGGILSTTGYGLGLYATSDLAPIKFFAGGCAAGSERMRITCRGNVGIGTASPSNLLHVCGAPTSNGLVARFQSTATSGSISISHSGNGGNIGYANIGAGNAANVFYVTTGAGTIGSGIVMDNGGNVGIGTCTPGSLLHIKGPSSSGASFGAELRLWENSFGAVLQGSTIGSTYAFFGNFRYNFSTPSSSETLYSLSGGGMLVKDGIHIFASNPNASTFTPAERLTIDNSGNVGIGATSPLTVLDIRGCNTDNAVTVRNFCGDSYSAIGYYNCQGTLKGALGIGNNSAAAPFANNAYVYTPASTDFLFYIAGAERMRVRCDGNIGIATTSPSYKLHVNGTFYAAGSSIKYKHSICDYDTDSCIFMCLKPVTYQYKDEWQHLGREMKSQSQIGLIAEDVAQVMPELAILVNEDEEKVVRNVDYEKLSVVLLKEVQKLRREMDDLKHKEQ